MNSLTTYPQFIAVQTGHPDYWEIYEFHETREEISVVYKKYRPLENIIYKSMEAAISKATELNEAFQKNGPPKGSEFGEASE